MLEGVAIKINLIFTNPSAFEVKIKSLELKTYFQNKILSSSVSTNVIEIKAKSNTSIILPTTILFKNIISNRKEIINELLDGKLTIQVVANINSNYGEIKINESKLIEL